MRPFRTQGFLIVGVLLVASPPQVLAQSQSVTYNRDVAPILAEHCVACHREGEFAPFSLASYEDAARHARQIAEVTRSRYMPPWKPEDGFGEFRGERHMPDEDIDILEQWDEEGAPRGDDGRRPPPSPPPAAADTWTLGPPDLIVRMQEPYGVPADGGDVFRNFVVPVPIAAKKYVRAIEFRPGNPKVIHHARILIDDTGEARRADEREDGPGFSGMENHSARFPDGHFLGWTPGKTPTVDPLAWPLEPGADIVLQMHFRPTGKPEAVRSSIGLYFTDKPPSITPIAMHLGSKTIDIPAGDPHYVVEDAYTLPVDATALRIYPHAHYLATDMTVTATLPNGTVLPLLHIPDWDFNWQDEYQYAKPVGLPKGAIVTMRYVYDNSSANPHNPSDPPVRVRYGPEATDEMGDLIVQLLPRSDREGLVLVTGLARKDLLLDIAGDEKRVRESAVDVEARNQLAVDYARAGRLPDALVQYDALLKIDPDHAVANYNLGVIALSQRQYGAAREFFGRALTRRPNYPAARTSYGVLLQLQGDVDGAMAQYRLAIEENAFQDTAHYNLGRALAARGDAAGAIEHFQRAVDVKPDSVDYLTSLSWLLATAPDEDLRDPAAAIKYATKASTLSGGQNPSVLDTLAAAYAADGRYDRAVAVAKTAFQRALASKNEALAGQIRARLNNYEQAAAASDTGFGTFRQ